MSKSLFSFSVLILLCLIISLHSSSDFESSKSSRIPVSFRQGTEKQDSLEIPEEISFPSNIGEVLFPHQLHTEDLEMECVECHHQINARILNTPHDDYFKSSWIKCEICHKESGQVKQQFYTCSECHHPGPENIADETLSSKVVIHKNCWMCHEVGAGVDASGICKDCHSGDKKEG